MAIDLYGKIEEFVEEMRGNWKALFESDEYGEFLSDYVKNLISGVYDSLRVEGAKLSDNILEREQEKFQLERIYDPNGKIAAACRSTEHDFVIIVNGAHELISRAPTTEEKHEVVVGAIIHEVGHRLFTDFRTKLAHELQMGKYGKWFPIPPANLQGVEGINLQMKLYQNPDYRETIKTAIAEIDNKVEDGYIENEMKTHYPGLASSYLAAMNSILMKDAATLTELQDTNVPKMNMVLDQWLTYAKFETLNIGERDESEFEPELMEVIYGGMDLIDEAVETRDPLRRASIINELTVMLSPFIDEEIKKQDPKNVDKGGGKAANQSIQNQIKQAGQQTNGGQPSNHSTGANGKPNTSQSITNTNRSSNSGLQKTVNGNTQKTGDNNGNNSIGGSNPKKTAEKRKMARGGEIDHSAAENDLSDMLTNAAIKHLNEEREKERKNDMQREADSIDFSFSGHAPKINRAEKVSQSNVQAYKKAAPTVHQIAKRLAKMLLKQMKEYSEEDTLAWQYSGNKFISKQFCRDELKGFQRNTLPRPVPNLSVYVLCDESGSVGKDLNTAEIGTAIILEDFCRTINIPLCIQGYTGSTANCEIFSYVEEKKIDDQDKYRITGMQPRGGTPTVCAMEYAIGRIHKQRNNEKTLLFVVTDGGAGDDDSHGTYTRKLIERAKKDKIIVVACGIGSDKCSVEDEFGTEHFMNIDDLDKMPLKLLDVIRRNMDGVRR